MTSHIVAITGANGRLGAALCRVYSERHQVVPLGRGELDLSVPGLGEKLAAVNFDTLIHCSALTNVDYCETHEAEAMRVNAEAAGELAELCANRGARMIQISTDYVFDGNKTEPYTEEDAAVPVSIYGSSKLAGEQAVLAAASSHLVARVSWVFGPDRPSFVDQVVQRALETDDLAAIGDKFSSPAYTLDLARYLEPLFTTHRNHGGVVHLANAGTTTWREYGEYAVDCAAELGAPVKGRTLRSLLIADMKNFVAKRPVHSSMSTAKFSAWTGVSARGWREAVREYIRDVAPVTAAFRR